MWRYMIWMIIFVGCSNNQIQISKNLNIDTEKYLLVKSANLYSNGKKQDALNLYDEILKKDKKNVIALREKGIIEAQLGNYNRAMQDLEKALFLSPKDSMILKNLAYLEFRKKNYNKSFDYMNSVSKELLTDDDYFILGYIEYEKHNYKKTIKIYEQLNDSKILNNKLYLVSYLNSIKFSNSLKNERFLKIEQQIIHNKYNMIYLADFYENYLKNTDFSEKVLKKYLINNDLDADILQKLAKIYYKNGDKTQGDKALKLISIIKLK